MTKQERRNEERIRRPRIAASCALLGEDRWNDVREPSRLVLDISTTGARLLVDNPLEPGDSLVVRLDHEPSQRSVQVAAEVRWVAPLAGVDSTPVGYVTGVRFWRSRGLLDMLLQA